MVWGFRGKLLLGLRGVGKIGNQAYRTVRMQEYRVLNTEEIKTWKLEGEKEAWKAKMSAPFNFPGYATVK